MAQGPCPLCLTLAMLHRVPDHDQFEVVCDRCVRYTISGDLMRMIQSAREQGDQRVIEQLSDLSAATRAEGGNLNLTTTDLRL
jgi:hypothetical protein